MRWCPELLEPFARVDFLVGARRLVELHARELPQKDDLCGAFCAAVALRTLGITGVSDCRLEQDDVAVRAGTTIFAGDYDTSLPPGERGRRDYVLKIPIVNAERLSGTSARGLARAVEEIGDGRVRVVPAAGEWTAERIARLLHAATSLERSCAVIANLATRFLWGSHPPLSVVLQYLEDGDPTVGPATDWDVGHFVLLVGIVHGRRGQLVVVADTYRSLGSSGIHVQPMERLAAAVDRPGENEGGLILICDPTEAAKIELEVRRAGLTSRLWENGSVDALALS